MHIKLYVLAAIGLLAVTAASFVVKRKLSD
jgi:hypothetical protein